MQVSKRDLEDLRKSGHALVEAVVLSFTQMANQFIQPYTDATFDYIEKKLAKFDLLGE